MDQKKKNISRRTGCPAAHNKEQDMQSERKSYAAPRLNKPVKLFALSERKSYTAPRLNKPVKLFALCT